MTKTAAVAAAPDAAEVAAICAIRDRVVRNLRITHAYHRLSHAMAARAGACSNWCTYATWASRQAGATIRGEDLFDHLRRRLGRLPELRHPVRSFWRMLLRKGLLEPDTATGRVVVELHTPLQAFERASDAVARGNLKVFEEIGLLFARYLAECPPDEPVTGSACVRFLESLRPGDPPDGQRYLRSAFTRYQRQRLERDPRVRAESIVLANLEIGLHEQTRLQPEIRESLDAPLATSRELKARLARAVVPGAGTWARAARRMLGPMAVPLARGLQRASSAVAREIITDRLMVLVLPGIVLRLGGPIDAEPPEHLRSPTEPDVLDFLTRHLPCGPDRATCGARDWANLPERMHVIAHLFMAYHEQPALFSAPFTDIQAQRILAGRVPDGPLAG